ncbi:hypothetical protein [Endothiovibrio diazotrophicus]
MIAEMAAASGEQAAGIEQVNGGRTDARCCRCSSPTTEGDCSAMPSPGGLMGGIGWVAAHTGELRQVQSVLQGMRCRVRR